MGIITTSTAVGENSSFLAILLNAENTQACTQWQSMAFRTSTGVLKPVYNQNQTGDPDSKGKILSVKQSHLCYL